MKTAIAASLAVLAVVPWVFLWQVTVEHRPTPSEILSKEITAFDSTKTRMIDQLVELAIAIEIPMAIEGIYAPQQKPSPEIHLRGATARDVLQEIRM